MAENSEKKAQNYVAGAQLNLVFLRNAIPLGETICKLSVLDCFLPFLSFS